MTYSSDRVQDDEEILFMNTVCELFILKINLRNCMVIAKVLNIVF